MAVKILGGTAKGFSLQTPKGNLIRPTSIVLRRKAFDTYQDWEDWIFVDACAGTGAMGLEAWSRGARRVYFIEKNEKVYSILSENLRKIRKSYKDQFESIELVSINQSIESWLTGFRGAYAKLSEEEKSKCLIFLDPPYKSKDVYEKVIFKKLIGEKWFKGWLWIESDEKKGLLPSELEDKGISFYDFIAQSNSYLAVVKVTEQQ